MRWRSTCSSSPRDTRISVLRPGTATCTDVSVSDESASLAAVHSARRRASPARTAGSLPSSSRSWPSSAASTWASTAWSTSIPPRRSKPFGRAEQLGPVLAVAHHRGVERATSEVEDGDGLAGLEPAEAGVVTGGGLGLGHQLDVVDAGDAAGLPEEIELELAPVRGMGQRDAVGPLTGLRLGRVDDVAQHMAHQCFGAERGAGEHVRRAVAEAPLELTGTCRGIGRQVALRGVAHDERRRSRLPRPSAWRSCARRAAPLRSRPPCGLRQPSRSCRGQLRVACRSSFLQ